MKLNPGFAFRPLPSIKKRPRFSSIHPGSPLGPLRDLPGTWTGRGFNVIWRPHHDRRHHRFLALNLFDETLQFEEAKGQIANRGLLQRDIYIFGVTYLQNAKDRHTNAGLHIETGIWATVPKTTNPAEPPTVVRIASIPHGAAMLAQGAPRHTKGPPKIPNADITPFVIEHPKMQIPFPEANLAVPSKLRSPTPDIRGVTQAMVHNPNSLLVSALSGQTVTETVTLDVSSNGPFDGGGVANMAFLKGSSVAGPNASVALVTATFWIEKVRGRAGRPDFHQLQYTQTVLLNFRGLSWPHVTVATLRKR